MGAPERELSRQIGCPVEENIQPGRKTVTSFRNLLLNLGKEHDQCINELQRIKKKEAPRTMGTALVK